VEHPLTSEATSVESNDMLARLGYQQKLKREINFLGNLTLALCDVSPTTSLFVVGTVVVITAGTGSILAYLIGGFIAISVALCMGELGSMFPVAGGLYSIVIRVLGKPIGFLAMLDYVGQAIFLPASVAIGCGVYINSLLPNIPSNIAATVIMIAITFVALFAIRINVFLTSILLVLELVVVSTLAFGYTHIHQPFSIVTNPVASNGHGGLTAITAGILIGAVATALFSVNGYDSAINFSEETTGAARRVGQAVVTVALLGIFFQVVPFIAVVVGVGDLAQFVNSTTPLTYAIKSAYGTTFFNIFTIGVIIAIFSGGLAVTLQFSRILMSTGRDKAWPQPISDWLSRVEGRRGAPWVATLFVGTLGTILAFQSTLASTVTFTAVLIVILYGLIAVSAIVSRIRQKELARPSRMPFWPLPPIIAVVGVVVALTQQTRNDLLLAAGIFVVGAVYYFAFLRPRAGRYWNMEPVLAASKPGSPR
jgi:amino acid transporter